MSKASTEAAYDPDLTPLGILAGSGSLPLQLVDACKLQGRPLFVVAFDGQTEPAAVDGVTHIWITLGQIGKAIESLKIAGIRDLVLAGRIHRPKIADLNPDFITARLLKRLGTTLLAGDNALFSTIVHFLEDEGFTVIGADEIVHEIVAPVGPLGKILPTRQAQKDIEIGARVAHAIGALDVGQAVIVKNGLVLGVEAAEGTDALIARAAALAGEGSGGVLVKAKKPLQERRVDLPAIGIQTVENVYQAGFAGIAIEAGNSLVLDRPRVCSRADALGIFIIGFSKDPNG